MNRIKEVIRPRETRQIVPREQVEEYLSMIQSRRDWLNETFLQGVTTRPENRYYIVAPEFNLRIPPDVLTVAAHDISEGLKQFIRGDEVVYGIPVAGDRVATPVAERLWLRSSPARKGENIPGAWENVLSLTTHSYTTSGKRVKINFGFVEPGMRVVLLDDVVATGKTIGDVIGAFNSREVEVVGVGVMFAKVFEGGIHRIQQEFGVPVIAPVLVEDVSESGELSLAHFDGNSSDYY